MRKAANDARCKHDDNACIYKNFKRITFCVPLCLKDECNYWVRRETYRKLLNFRSAYHKYKIEQQCKQMQEEKEAREKEMWDKEEERQRKKEERKKNEEEEQKGEEEQNGEEETEEK